ncbi:MAG: Holliday junction branch migration protein RuvA [Prevotellaceae bacterium]|jgi:Holliday junction DNA helicase RuvA|nr:Holliday junction branch migration protein RuvA [Prevotellaceae bacterium]
MYEYIKGDIYSLTPTTAVVETGGIGYFVNISLQTYTKIGQERKVFLLLHHVIREDAHLLFGFFDEEEREIFRQLISVTGVGVNTARMMLSSLSSSDIAAAIEKEDVTRLKGVKGIGLKTAQRIIVDLKGKVNEATLAGKLAATPTSRNKEEAMSALITLGFTRASVEKVLDTLTNEGLGSSVEELIKQSLKRL